MKKISTWKNLMKTRSKRILLLNRSRTAWIPKTEKRIIVTGVSITSQNRLAKMKQSARWPTISILDT